jgi:subtilisin-like proprotein convertase family protein
MFKNILIALPAVLFVVNAQAQVFSGNTGAILNNGTNTLFTCNVSGLSQSQLDNNFGLLQVCLNITHPDNSELNVYLKSPSGTMVHLLISSSAAGSNYTNTCLDSRLSNSVTLATAPYSGSYKPIGYLGRFNNGQAGNGNWTLIVKDYLVNSNAGTLNNWSIEFGSSPPPPVSFTSSNLPIVIINTTQPITDTDILADMGIINNAPARNYTTDTWNNYNGKITINLHGHSTLQFEKKPYKFATCDAAGNDSNVSILGMPAEADWILLADYTDKTLMRNFLTYDLSRSMGHYASRCKKVELILNNEYQGVYTLCEKVKRGHNRVNVSKMDSTVTTNPGITGGYIFQIDHADQIGWYSLYPGDSPSNAHFFYQQIYPKDSSINPTQAAYIKDVVDSFETAMQSPGFADTATGYPHFVEINSFIDYFIINELSKNVDSYRLSTYMYKDNISAGGKIHIGPVWDYDLAWHNCNYGNAFSPLYWQYQVGDNDFPPPTWWRTFLQDTTFANALHCRWLYLRSTILSNANLDSYIDSLVNLLSESQVRNFTQWPTLATYIWPNPQNENGANYTSEINDLKNWIDSRIAWLDSNIPGTGSCLSGIDEVAANGVSAVVYPNPFLDNFTVNYTVPQGSRVKVELLSTTGTLVDLAFDGVKAPGEYSTTISSASLASGLYILRITENTSVLNKRIVKVNMN